MSSQYRIAYEYKDSKGNRVTGNETLWANSEEEAKQKSVKNHNYPPRTDVKATVIEKL